MYLYQSTEELSKFVNLQKRSLGVIAGAAIGIIVLVLFIFSLIIAYCCSSKRLDEQGERALYTSQYQREEEEAQMQERRQSALMNTFQGPLIIYNNGAEHNITPVNQTENPEDFVPPYSANANDNDMGYYDPEGNFHPVDSMKPPSSPPVAYVR